MDVYVDDSLCIGCGLCVDLAPSMFRFNSDGVSVAYGHLDDDNQGAVKESIEGCPTEAIHINE